MISDFHLMVSAEARAKRARKSIRIGVALSLALHALLLFYYLLFPTPPDGGGRDSRFIVRSPIQATIPKRAQSWQVQQSEPAKQSSQKNAKSKSSKQKRDSIITSKGGNWSVGSKKPEVSEPTPNGATLAQRALSMARGIGREELDGGTDSVSTQQNGKGKEIEPLSLQWYFDSFIKKLNSSARFVPREPRKAGQQKALVEIMINPDGSLKEYKIHRAADQASEIAYIKSVVNMAVPFAAFPPDIRDRTKALSLSICIQPPGGEGGVGFSRSSGGDC